MRYLTQFCVHFTENSNVMHFLYTFSSVFNPWSVHFDRGKRCNYIWCDSVSTARVSDNFLFVCSVRLLCHSVKINYILAQRMGRRILISSTWLHATRRNDNFIFPNRLPRCMVIIFSSENDPICAWNNFKKAYTFHVFAHHTFRKWIARLFTTTPMGIRPMHFSFCADSDWMLH